MNFIALGVAVIAALASLGVAICAWLVMAGDGNEPRATGGLGGIR